MLEPAAAQMRCAMCDDERLETCVFTPGTDGHVRDGVLTCRGCGAWYPIEHDLLELVEPSLLNAADLEVFCVRFSAALSACGIAVRGSAAAAADSPQLKQRRHFDWFAVEATETYDTYQQSPFWRAADRSAFSRWTPRLGAGMTVLDVGCANGRSAWPILATGATVVGCDISKKLVAQAIAHARAKGLHATTTFIVADADRLPFQTGAFDAVITYGALHHLPDPGKTCREIQRVLCAGGVHLGSENNKSAFRAVFDALMKIVPLWIEEAGEEPLISESMLRRWLDGVPVSIACTTQVFVPPHLVDALGESAGGALLTVTDKIGAHLPMLRRNGGLIVFEVRKTDADRAV